jgi:gluconate kinase
LQTSNVNRIVHAVDGQPVPIVLIDGRSGSGKSTLACDLAPRLGAQLVRLDDLYPGWDGLEEGSRMVGDDILQRARWRRWDWNRAAAAEWNFIDGDVPLIIEGSGSLSRANRSRATFGVWVELDEPTRKKRALHRDGESYAPFWDRWAAQEQMFFDRERPDLVADLRIDRSWEGRAD